MRAYVTKVDPLKRSASGVEFIRVYFQMEDGKWAATDVCPAFRNFAWWRPVLRVGPGAVLGRVLLLREGKVNADSHVEVTGRADVSPFAGEAQKAKDDAKEQEQRRLQPCLPL